MGKKSISAVMPSVALSFGTESLQLLWLWRNPSCHLEAGKQCLLNRTHVSACPPHSETNNSPVFLSVKWLVCVSQSDMFLSPRLTFLLSPEILSEC